VVNRNLQEVSNGMYSWKVSAPARVIPKYDPNLSSSFASARHDQIEKLICRRWIKASQFPDGIQGGCPIAGKVISKRESMQGHSILRIDPQGLAAGFDGVLVAMEQVVSDPRLAQTAASFGLIRRAWR